MEGYNTMILYLLNVNLILTMSLFVPPFMDENVFKIGRSL